MRAGDVYGAWLVIDPYIGGQYARCRCACGHERKVARPNLVSGASSRCPTCSHRLLRERSRKSLAGAEFGCWKVIADPRWKDGVRNRRVEVLCSICGDVRTLVLGSLRKRPAKCPKCYQADLTARSLATAPATAATGLSRQGIHQRVARGWTRQEAQTLPKGATPERLRVLRAKSAA